MPNRNLIEASGLKSVHSCCAGSRKVEAAFEGEKAVPHYAPDYQLTIRHSHIHISGVLIKERELRVKVSHSIHCPVKTASAAPLPINKLCLNAVGFLDVRVEGCDEHQYTGKLLHLHWRQPFNAGEERLVTVEYRVKRPVGGLYFSAWDDPGMSQWYAITDNETEKARYWLACIDYPSSRPTVSFEIFTPADMISLANGQLVETVRLENDESITKWELKFPCPSYLLSFAVGKFERVDDVSVNNMPISYFAPIGYAKEDIHRAFKQTPAMISWLEKKLNYAFPWPKYYQIAAPHYGCAMENISLVTWNDSFVMDPVLSLERQYIMDLINIHEMAHTYFGDLIVIRHFEHVWLKESWATYMESVWLQDHLGDDHFRYEMFENAEQYIEETGSYLRPIVNRTFSSSWAMFDRHTYPGGAWRIHMLRKLLGDQCFWSAVQDYVSQYSGKCVETDDFRKVLESHCGVNLTRFFDEWFYSKSFPQLEASYEYCADKKMIKLSLEQTQADAAKKIPLFHFDLDVLVIDDCGKEHREIASFNSDSKKVFVNIQLGEAKPRNVIIDPDQKILFSLSFSPNEDILLQNAKSGDVATRIRSYRELIKLGGFSAMLKLETAIGEEKFYGVRVKVATALAQSKTNLAVKLLAKIVSADTDPMALWLIAKECRVRDSELRSVLLQVLSRKDLPYRAKASLYESLGYQQNSDDIARLLSAANDPSEIGQHNIVRCGIIKALSHYAKPEVFNYLLNLVKDLSRLPRKHVRQAAIVSLAKSASIQTNDSNEKTVAQVLFDIAMRDEDEESRESALSGLTMLSAAVVQHYTDLLINSKTLYAEQHWHEIEAQVSKIQGGLKDGANAEKWKSRIEALEEKLRKLEEKLGEAEREKSASHA